MTKPPNTNRSAPLERCKTPSKLPKLKAVKPVEYSPRFQKIISSDRKTKN